MGAVANTKAKGEEISAACSVLPLEPGESQGLAAALASMDPWVTLGYGAPELAGYLTRVDPALERFSLWVGGGVSGVLCVRFPWLRGPFVELLAVLPEAQGRGVGRDVMSWVERRPRWSTGNVWVTVSAFNTVARGFYGRCGFEEIAWLPRLVAAGRDEILLRKSTTACPEGSEAR